MAVAITYASNNKADPDPTDPYTFSGQTIAAGDYIIVAVGARWASANSVAAVTVGGNAGTSLITHVTNSASGYNAASLWIATHPGGGTANIILDSTSGAIARAVIGVWSISGISSTAVYHSATSTADPATGNINCPANGGVLAFQYDHVDAATSSWTGLTSRYHTRNTDPFTHTGASDIFGTTQTGLAVTSDLSSAAVAPVFFVVSWAPLATIRSYGVILD